jgi:hypothetical protein
MRAQQCRLPPYYLNEAKKLYSQKLRAEGELETMTNLISKYSQA